MPPVEFNRRTAQNAVLRDSAPYVTRPQARVPELVDDPRHRVEEIQDQFIPHDATLEIPKGPFGQDTGLGSERWSDIFGNGPDGQRWRDVFGNGGSGEEGERDRGGWDLGDADLSRIIGGSGGPGGARDRFKDLGSIIGGAEGGFDAGELGLPDGSSQGLIKFKGEDFLGRKPSHPGPATYPEYKEPPKSEEQKPTPAWEMREAEGEWDAGDGNDEPDKEEKPNGGGRPPEDGHRPADDGTGPTGPRSRDYMPADDGTGPTGPRSRDYMPADDGTGPVGPRSAAVSKLSALNVAAVKSVAVGR